MLTPILNKKSAKPLYSQIYDFVINEIREGRLISGDGLPSVRGLSAHLKISSTTVENAYNQLLAEGYIISYPGKGYYVEAVSMLPTEVRKHYDASEEEKASVLYDFAGEYVAEGAFDFKVWKRQINYVLNYEQRQLYAYGKARGELALRKEISQLFYRSRGVHADPSNIVVGAGVTPLLTMLARLLCTEGIGEIALENPGFKKAFGVFVASQMSVSSLDVREGGVDIEGLKYGTARACYVSPSHHFPTGVIMPVNERVQLLRWAEDVDGYIIEDDYNFELRFEGQPIPAMQGMDQNDKVIYLGSFSTVLVPAIRISFMVLPKALSRKFDEDEAMFPQTASKIEQLALARFISTGEFEKHVKKVRKIYMRKQQKLIQILEDRLMKDIEIVRVKSGLQVLLRLPESMDEIIVIDACMKASIKIDGLSKYLFGNTYSQSGAYLIVGYRGIDEDDMEQGLLLLADVLNKKITS